MATPKMNEILKQFLGGIGQAAVFENGVLQDGVLLPSAAAVSYVNRALFVLLDEMVSKVDAGTVAVIQPDLAKVRSVTLTNGVFIPAGGSMDFLKLIYARSAVLGKAFRRVKLLDLDAALSGENGHFLASDDAPIVTESEGKLFFYPLSVFDVADSENVEICYLIKPVDPVSGALLIQNGETDVPFQRSWFTKIAQVADGLYKKDMQESM